MCISVLCVNVVMCVCVYVCVSIYVYVYFFVSKNKIKKDRLKTIMITRLIEYFAENSLAENNFINSANAYCLNSIL